MSTKVRERLDAISADLSKYVGVRTHEALAELIDIVAGLLPGDPAPPVVTELPHTFYDRDGDAIRVEQDGGECALITVMQGTHSAAVYVEPRSVDEFVGAVLKATGRGRAYEWHKPDGEVIAIDPAEIVIVARTVTP